MKLPFRWRLNVVFDVHLWRAKKPVLPRVHQWVEEDVWSAEVEHGAFGIYDNLLHVEHRERLPIGTVLLHTNSGEYLRVIEHVDIPGLRQMVRLERDIAGRHKRESWFSRDRLVIIGMMS